MSTAPPQPNHSRDLALAAIERAHREIGLRGEEPVQLDETGFRPERETKATRLLAKEPQPTPPRAGDASLGRPVLWSFMGVLALVGAGAAGFVWQKVAERAALDPISTATVSTAKRELAPAATGVAARTEAALSQPSPQAETAPQRAAPVASTPAISSDSAQSVQMMARELASARESIDQLKAAQVQMVRDNAELTEHLKSALETARLTTDLAEDLKLTRAQMARDNADFTERVKANQEQMARLTEQLKAGQDQIAHLVAAEQKAQQSEQRPRQAEQQKPRPRAVASAPPRPASSVRKPPPPAAAASPQARAQTQEPRRLPPKPQPQVQPQ